MKNFLHNIQEKISFFKKNKSSSSWRRRKKINSTECDSIINEDNIHEESISNKKYSSKCLQYKTDRDNYKCKRKQLKIDYWFIQKSKIIGKYKHLVLFSIFPVVASIFLFILYGPIYTVKYIDIFPQDSISNITLSYSAVENFYHKKLINIEEKNIEEKIKQYQNNIKNIELSYKLPDTLDIKITSFPIYYNTTIKDKSYYITQNGTLVPGKPREEYKTMIVKSKIDKNILPDYKSFYHQEHMEAIYEAYQYLEDNVIDIKIEELYYYPIEREIHFKLDNETLLIYSLSKDLKMQIKKTVIYNTEHKKLSDNDVVYIDFRIKRVINNSQKDKIYYCTKETEYQCFQNLKKIY